MSGILRRQLVEDLVEEAVRQLHDVVFGEGGDLGSTVVARVFEGVANDALAAGAGDELEGLHDVGGLAVFDPGVEVFFVLADQHHVHVGVVLGLDVGMERGGGAHVGEEAERDARGDVEALEAAALRRGDGRLEEDSGASDRFPRGVIDAGGDAAAVDLLTDLDDFRLDARPGSLEHVHDRRHDLGADAVAIGHGDRGLIGHTRTPLVARDIPQRRIHHSYSAPQTPSEDPLRAE